MIGKLSQKLLKEVFLFMVVPAAILGLGKLQEVLNERARKRKEAELGLDKKEEE